MTKFQALAPPTAFARAGADEPMLEPEQSFTVGQGRLAGVGHQAADDALYQQQTGARHFLKMATNVRLNQERNISHPP